MAREIDLKDYKGDFLQKILKEMLLIRRFEERAAQAYGLQKIGGFLHLYIGQEAVAVGSISALDLKRDYVLTGYRDHGHALACGMAPGPGMAELYGRIDGCSRGKGGSMHFFDVKNHMIGGNGIVGAQIPLATGYALKIKYMEEDGVVLCYFGDGAIHQGAFHESLNLARIWNLPVIYICENNQYGMGTDFRRVSSLTDLYRMGESYDIPGSWVDGMDVLSVYEEVFTAVHRARTEKIPSLIEARTYRYKGHSASDPARYRTREELEGYRNQDPIILLKEAMTNKGLLTGDEYEDMDGQAKALVAEAVDFAEKSPQPPLETLYEDLWV